MRISDWSSDVCSSDLAIDQGAVQAIDRAIIEMIIQIQRDQNDQERPRLLPVRDRHGKHSGHGFRICHQISASARVSSSALPLTLTSPLAAIRAMFSAVGLIRAG